MCCEGSKEGITVGECPDCGGNVDIDGDSTEWCCYYSPEVCSTCHWRPCDESC